MRESHIKERETSPATPLHSHIDNSRIVTPIVSSSYVYEAHPTVLLFTPSVPMSTPVAHTSQAHTSKCLSSAVSGWGGRVSDKYLTQNCGFLNLLEYGDTVLADRGFNISEDFSIIWSNTSYFIIYKREVAAKPARSWMLSKVSKGSDSCRESQMKANYKVSYQSH